MKSSLSHPLIWLLLALGLAWLLNRAFTSSKTASSTNGLQLNEFMPRPATDWNGDDEISPADEYIELINRSSQAIELTGLRLDDIEGGTSPYLLRGTLQSGQIALYFKRETGIGLNDGGDTVRLLAEDGTILDWVSYPSAQQDQAWSRDEAGTWHNDWVPSPGESNQIRQTPTPTLTFTPTPTQTLTFTPTFTPTATLTPTPTFTPTATSTPTLSATPTLTPTATTTGTPTQTAIPAPTSTPTTTLTLTPSPIPSPSTIPTGLYLNEFMPRPINDWNGNGEVSTADEYIELINLSGQPFSLQGLQLDDQEGGSSSYMLTGTIQIGEIALFFRSQTGIALNDTGDEVRLLAIDGAILDFYSYPSASRDQAFSRDEAGVWHDDWAPSPNEVNQAPPTPTLTPTFTPTATSTPTLSATPTLTPTATTTGTPTQTAIPAPTSTQAATLTLTPSPIPSPSAIPTGLYLNEFMPRPIHDWNGDGEVSTADEYIELINLSGQPFDLTGLQLDDQEGGSSSYMLTDTIQIGEIALFFRSQTGIALNDTGDEVRLLAIDGAILDFYSYPSASRDQAFSRDEAGVWHDDWAPSPNEVNQAPPTPTLTPTFTPTATSTPTLSATPTVTPAATSTHTPTQTAIPAPTSTQAATLTLTPSPIPSPSAIPTGLYLNEFMPRPISDWNGDGEVSTRDEYVELINLSGQPFDLTGLQLDDEEGGSSSYMLTGTIEIGEIALFFRSQTGIALNDTGDEVRLLAIDGAILDFYSYPSASGDQAFSRDEAYEWHDDWLPSPNEVNQAPPTPTLTPTFTPTATSTPTLSPTATVTPAATSTHTPTQTAIPAPTSTATATLTLTPSPIPSPSAIPTGLYLNEFMPRPISDWNGDGEVSTADEYIELINLSGQPFDLTGLQLDDREGGSSSYMLTGTIEIGEIALFFRSQTGIALNDTGDEVRLLAIDGAILDVHSYSSAAQDQAFSRDEGGEWHDDWAPSPGQANQAAPTATPTLSPTLSPTLTPTLSPTAMPQGLYLNEFMPRPATDWNQDGVADTDDEYIELVNLSSEPFALSGLRLDDNVGGSSAYVLTGTLEVGEMALFFRGETGIALNDSGDEVRLLAPDDFLLDAVIYSSAAQDQALSRDAQGKWHDNWPPSPGMINEPPGTPTATSTMTPSVTPTPIPPGLYLNEFMPRPISDWNDDGAVSSDDEYIELINLNNEPFDLTGLLLDDREGGSLPYPLSGTLEPAQLKVFWRSETGLALNDSEDEIRLLAADGTLLDAQSYLSVAVDQAYSRDQNHNWHDDWLPSPGDANQAPPTPTATLTASLTFAPNPTFSPTPTLLPTTIPQGLYLNEFMARPISDWNADGEANTDDEYIELINLSDQPFDLAGLQLDDQEEGSPAYTLEGLLEVDQVIVFWRTQTGLALNDTGDEVRLLAPDGMVLDQYTYTSAAQDQAYSRDESHHWHDNWAPSPGEANQAPPSTTETLTPTPIFSPPPTALPTATLTPPPTPSPTAIPEGLRLNEFMARPASDWNADGVANTDDEYIELINLSDQAFNLAGLLLDDAEGGSSPYVLSGTLQADGLHLLSRTETGLALNDNGDEVRLLAPDGTMLDQHIYTSMAQDQAYSRDESDTWYDNWPPSPGNPNQEPPSPTQTSTQTATLTPTPSPTATLPPTSTPLPTAIPQGLHLNEFMARPASDWNSDGVVNTGDEYIELINLSGQRFDLAGLQLDDGEGGSSPYPLEGTLDVNQVMIFWGSQTGLSLNDSGDDVRLLAAADGTILDEYAYSSVAKDQAYSWDKSQTWYDNWEPSPGEANQAPPAVTPSPTLTPTVALTSMPSFTPPTILSPTPTTFPTAIPQGLHLNEFMARPASDWNSDGVVNTGDEYIELINLSGQRFDLAALLLDDGEGGSSPYSLEGTLDVNQVIIFWGSQTGLSLNDSGDDVRLLAADGSILDEYGYSSAAKDQVYSWDKRQTWYDDWEPSPGEANQAPPIPSATVTLTPSLSATPSLPPTAIPQGLYLNEFMARPASDWNGDGEVNPEDEYIELINLSGQLFNLAGLLLDDGEGGSSPYPLEGILSINQVMIFWRNQTGLALNDNGDDVRLLTVDGSILDEYPYSSAAQDQAYNRAQNGTWYDDWQPSPGKNNLTRPTPAVTFTLTPIQNTSPSLPPTAIPQGLYLNEFMARPASDWNGDGEGGTGDEYIELINLSGQMFELSGLQLDDGEGGSSPYTLDGILAQNEIKVFFRSQTGLALNDSGGDAVRLLAPDGTILDSVAYPSAKADQAFSRDETGDWHDDWLPSPHTPNSSPSLANDESPQEEEALSSSQPPSVTPLITSTLPLTATSGITVTSPLTSPPNQAPRPSLPMTMGLRLNEFMAHPARDWNGDGEVNQKDEYIELINLSDKPLNLAGFFLDDSQDDSLPYILTGTLEIGDIALFFRHQTGIALDDKGWEFVRLLAPDGSLLDGCSYTILMTPDMAWSRDEQGIWHDNWLPSPNMPNQPPAQPTAIPSPSATPTPNLNEDVFGTSTDDLTPEPEASNQIESQKLPYIYACLSILLVIIVLSLVIYGYKRRST